MFKKYYNLIVIILGIFLALLSSYTHENENMLLTLGILVMLFGLFRISRTIPDKTNDDNNTVIDEEEE